MLKVICLQSDAGDPAVARQALIEQLDASLGIYRPQAALLFSSYEQTPPHEEALTQLLTQLHQQFPALQLAGCSMTAGFADASGYTKHGFFLTLFISDALEYSSGLVTDLKMLQADEQGFADRFQARLDDSSLDAPRVSLIFPAYHEVNGDRLVADVQGVTGDECVVFGGIAATYWSDQLMDDVASGKHQGAPDTETALQFCICNGEVQIADGALAFLNLHGELDVDVQYTYGWSIDAKQHELSVRGKIIEKINNIDAVTYLKKINHPLLSHSDFASYPFWIHENGRKPYQRDVFYDEEQGILYTGNSDWSEAGSNIAVSFSFPLGDVLEKEYKDMLDGFSDEYDFAFSVACSSRVIAQRESIGRESVDQSATFQNTPVLGGYFFGEFFPWQGTAQDEKGSLLHSCSSAVLAIKTLSTASNADTAPDSVQGGFLGSLLEERNVEIEELKNRLAYFDGQQSIAEMNLLKDVLGILLHKSRRTVNAHAVELAATFAEYYKDVRKKPYVTSRARLIAALNPLKKAGSEKFFGKK